MRHHDSRANARLVHHPLAMKKDPSSELTIYYIYNGKQIIFPLIYSCHGENKWRVKSKKAESQSDEWLRLGRSLCTFLVYPTNKRSMRIGDSTLIE